MSLFKLVLPSAVPACIVPLIPRYGVSRVDLGPSDVNDDAELEAFAAQLRDENRHEDIPSGFDDRGRNVRVQPQASKCIPPVPETPREPDNSVPHLGIVTMQGGASKRPQQLPKPSSARAYAPKKNATAVGSSYDKSGSRRDAATTRRSSSQASHRARRPRRRPAQSNQMVAEDWPEPGLARLSRGRGQRLSRASDKSRRAPEPVLNDHCPQRSLRIASQGAERKRSLRDCKKRRTGHWGGGQAKARS